MTSEDQIKAALAKHIKPWEMDGFPCVTGIPEAAAEIAALALTARSALASPLPDGGGDRTGAGVEGASPAGSDYSAQPEPARGLGPSREYSSREARLLDDRNKLAAFARDILSECEDIDGGTLQDLGVKHGLLVETAFDPETHNDDGYGLEPGDFFYGLANLCAPLAPGIETVPATTEGCGPKDESPVAAGEAPSGPFPVVGPAAMRNSAAVMNDLVAQGLAHQHPAPHAAAPAMGHWKTIQTPPSVPSHPPGQIRDAFRQGWYANLDGDEDLDNPETAEFLAGLENDAWAARNPPGQAVSQSIAGEDETHILKGLWTARDLLLNHCSEWSPEYGTLVKGKFARHAFEGLDGAIRRLNRSAVLAPALSPQVERDDDDREIDRILGLSGEEIHAELVAEGHDPDQLLRMHKSGLDGILRLAADRQRWRDEAASWRRVAERLEEEKQVLARDDLRTKLKPCPEEANEALCCFPSCTCAADRLRYDPARAEAPAPSPRGEGWQPIETAPKDGTTIDIGTVLSRVCDVFWDPEQRDGGAWSFEKDRRQPWRDRRHIPSGFAHCWMRPPALPAPAQKG